jgi:hypothetical protein
MKAIFFAYSWLLLATGIILTGAAATKYYQLYQQSTPSIKISSAEQNVLVSTANSARSDQYNDKQFLQVLIQTADARAQIVANFLERHNSPLKPYDHFGRVFVDLADAYHFDFRLLPAIAMQESNLCKSIPPDSYNCLGFGIHERGTLTFSSYEEGFQRAARELKKYYIDYGLTTPEQIMRKYTPSSNGSWANSVNQWMAEMRYDDRALGRSMKTDTDVREFANLEE